MSAVRDKTSARKMNDWVFLSFMGLILAAPVTFICCVRGRKSEEITGNSPATEGGGGASFFREIGVHNQRQHAWQLFRSGAHSAPDREDLTSAASSSGGSTDRRQPQREKQKSAGS